MNRRAFVTLLGAVLAVQIAAEGYTAGVTNTSPQLRRVVSERMLPLATGRISRFYTSPDARHLAVVAAVPGGFRVSVDGKTGPGPYAGISHPVFSPNSARVAYGATMNDRSTLVLDGVEGPWYDSVSDALFSPNSARVAYSVFTRMPAPVWLKWQVVIDGTPSALFGGPNNPYITFSPDSTRIAYHYSPTGDRPVTVLDGQPVSIPGYDSIAAEFIPNGVAYRARKAGKEAFFLLINGREVGGPYRRVGFLSSSPDGRRMAYTMMEDACSLCFERAVVDGAVGPPYFAIGRAIIFSPDGTRWAYTAVKRPDPNGWVVVVDGREYARGSEPVFSPDSRRIGLLRESLTPPGLIAVVDGQEGRPYKFVRELVFSPDSRHFAYGAQRGENLLLVVDGSERKEYPRAVDSTPLVIPTFSPDSRHVLYIAPIANSQAVVVDENEGTVYDKIMTKIVFDSATRFHYVARKSNGVVYLVEEELVEVP